MEDKEKHAIVCARESIELRIEMLEFMLAYDNDAFDFLSSPCLDDFSGMEFEEQEQEVARLNETLKVLKDMS